MTFFFAIAIAPLERQTHTIIGSISGVNPTANRQRPNKKAPPQSLLAALGQFRWKSILKEEAVKSEIAAAGMCQA